MNAPPRELVFRVSNVIFELAVLAVALHGIRLLGPLVPLIVIAAAMAIGAIRSVRGLVATLRGIELDRPGNVLAPRGIPHSTVERLPTVLLVAVISMMSLMMLTVFGLPGLSTDQALANGAVETPGWITWADDRFPRAHPVEYMFRPNGSEDEMRGRSVLVGPSEYLPRVGDAMRVHYAPVDPRISRIDPPQGLGDFPHRLATAELGTVTLAGWVYLISLFVQRPRDED